MIADDICLGHHMMIAGLPCEVVKKETVFHRLPDQRVRLELRIIDSDKENVVLFFEWNTLVEVIA